MWDRSENVETLKLEAAKELRLEKFGGSWGKTKRLLFYYVVLGNYVNAMIKQGIEWKILCDMCKN